MILNILFTFPMSFIYNQIYEKFKLTQSTKLANSFTAVSHASSTVALSFIYFFTNRYSFLIQINSGGYYLYDLYYMIQKNKFDLLRVMYLYHHCVTYMYILLDSNKYYWVYSMFFAELSNFPNYLVYYNLQLDKKLKLKNKSQSTINSMKIQLYTYGIIRIIVLGYLGLLDLQHDETPYIIYMMSVLYIFGLIWFSFMCLQHIKLIKNK